jgi:hypothetical protein
MNGEWCTRDKLIWGLFKKYLDVALRMLNEW